MINDFTTVELPNIICTILFVTLLEFYVALIIMKLITIMIVQCIFSIEFRLLIS